MAMKNDANIYGKRNRKLNQQLGGVRGSHHSFKFSLLTAQHDTFIKLTPSAFPNKSLVIGFFGARTDSDDFKSHTIEQFMNFHFIIRLLLTQALKHSSRISHFIHFYYRILSEATLEFIQFRKNTISEPRTVSALDLSRLDHETI